MRKLMLEELPRTTFVLQMLAVRHLRDHVHGVWDPMLRERREVLDLRKLIFQGNLQGLPGQVCSGGGAIVFAWRRRESHPTASSEKNAKCHHRDGNCWQHGRRAAGAETCPRRHSFWARFVDGGHGF